MEQVKTLKIGLFAIFFIILLRNCCGIDFYTYCNNTNWFQAKNGILKFLKNFENFLGVMGHGKNSKKFELWKHMEIAWFLTELW